MIVVDVTMLSYFVIEGDLTDGVVRVREKDPEWAAPELWRSELMNVLWKYMRRGDFDLNLALEHFDLAQDLIGPRSYGVTPLQVLPLATSSGCSAYDCQYVALARQFGVKLLTHDGAVLKDFPEDAFRPKDFLGMQ